ncbi:MAG: response regulator transcription factor [Spirosomataceae bacterium]
MHKILYVEDDPNLSFVIKDNLEMDGYNVRHCADGKEAWEVFQGNSFDICLLDVMLPHLDGFTLAEKIRNVNAAVPIIFLTARNQQEDRIAGLSIGADDYIAKPFNMDELLLKMKIFIKRKSILIEEVSKNGSTQLKIGSFLFLPKDQKLLHPLKNNQLTAREAELLHFLTKKVNNVAKREDILIQIWGRDDYFLGRSLDVFITRLRKMLSLDPQVKIENIHGVGFKLVSN